MSKNVTINVDVLGETVNKALDEYDRAVIDKIKKSAKSHMEDLVDETKKTAPKKTGKLSRCISSKVEEDNRFGATYVWYVKQPRTSVAHLVENGHGLRRGGRVSGTHFIKNATDKIIAEYEKDVEEVLKDD